MKNSNKAARKKKQRRSKTAETWFKQAGWLIKTIEDLHLSPSAHGLLWTFKMIRHYERQYDVIVKRTPKPCETLRAEYDLKIKEILTHYTEFTD